MRVVLFANGRSGVQVALRLARTDDIVGLVLHPSERATEREAIVAASGVAADRVFEADAALPDLGAEIGLVVYFGYILPTALLERFPHGVLNLHPALLPYNRGAYPNVWSIVERTPAGVTLHWLDAGIDTGDIVAQREVPVAPEDTGAKLYRKLESAGLELFERAWPLVRAGKAGRAPQGAGGTAHKRRDVERIDRIDLDRSYRAGELIDVLRARTFPPHAGAYFEAGGERVQLRLELARQAAPRLTIAGRAIGPGAPAYVVAEMSANHGGSIERACDIVRAAARAGADAVKLQTYTADTLTIDCALPAFRIGAGTPWEGRTLHELYREAATPWDWTPRLAALARELGIHLFSSPFDASAVDFLERLGMPAYKIASFELTDHALLRRVAATGKPVIVSTGLATYGEIADSVAVLRAAGVTDLALLKCTSAYPAPPESMHLRTIPDLAASFGVVAGLSDHTLGTAAPIAATALGASIVEKHLTLRRSDGGADAAFSLEPSEFAAMVEGIRLAERARGEVTYGLTAPEMASRVFRRSLFVVEDIRAGEPFTPRNVRSIRPGHGLPPKHLDEILGQRAAADIARGTPLSWELIGPKRQNQQDGEDGED